MNDYLFDCSSCSSRCDGISKGVYIFLNDVDYSEKKENQLISQINKVEGYLAFKCEKPGYPDIEVFHKESKTSFYIEVKAQRRTFMSVKRILPNGNLEPSETLALNLSDLVRYFKIRKETGQKVYILWCVENRSCIVDIGKTKYFYQDTIKLEEIYNHFGDKRRFRRKSGKGDVVNGQHKGVVVNYHFSLNELEELSILKLLKEGIE